MFLLFFHTYFEQFGNLKTKLPFWSKNTTLTDHFLVREDLIPNPRGTAANSPNPTRRPPCRRRMATPESSLESMGRSPAPRRSQLRAAAAAEEEMRAVLGIYLAGIPPA